MMAEGSPKKVAKVVVLGDIGRSPRMQYHALSLANSGLKVVLVGYLDSLPLPEILEHRNIHISKLKPLQYQKGPKLIQYALKAIWQFYSLFVTLLITGKCDYVLCQNPPAIPTLPVCRLYTLFSRSKLIIDWHNYAFSIMALSLSDKHPLLLLAKKIEMWFGKFVDGNLCVSNAMKDDLLVNWNIRATVLYDRPPHLFRPITLKEKHDWFNKIREQYPEFNCSGRDKLNLPSGDGDLEKTALTQITNGEIVLRSDRPGILFSSTSWTADEDFGILFDALKEYEINYASLKNLPKLICVITGKGPMKDYYVDLMKSQKWQHVKVVTPWLEACDYPTMVASADLGVCLHTSSSGLDLPMKVVDMFGTGLPVCAYNFHCIGELVQNGNTGYIFENSDELATLLVKWFDGFPNNVHQNQLIEKMRGKLALFQENRWEENWNLRAKKFFA